MRDTELETEECYDRSVLFLAFYASLLGVAEEKGVNTREYHIF